MEQPILLKQVLQPQQSFVVIVVSKQEVVLLQPQQPLVVVCPMSPLAFTLVKQWLAAVESLLSH